MQTGRSEKPVSDKMFTLDGMLSLQVPGVRRGCGIPSILRHACSDNFQGALHFVIFVNFSLASGGYLTSGMKKTRLT